VTDSRGNSEKAVTLIDVGNNGNIYSATTNVRLIGDGKTDNSSRFQSWINSASGNAIVEFQSGTYKFSSQVSFNDNAGLISLILRPAKGANVKFLFSPPPDGAGDTMFSLSIGNDRTYKLLITGINIEADLGGKSPISLDNRTVMTPGETSLPVFQNCTIRNFTSGIRGYGTQRSGIPTSTHPLGWQNGGSLLLLHPGASPPYTCHDLGS